jgi:mannosyl-oligosaccharide alpha-1,2-mannosidase
MLTRILRSKGIRRLFVIVVVLIIILYTISNSKKNPASAQLFTEINTQQNIQDPPAKTIKGIQKGDREMQEKVKEMMMHAWSGYKKYAWGCDEIKPDSNRCYNWTSTGSLLFTPIDSLDTLYIMGLKKEFQIAKELVLTIDFSTVSDPVNHFETTIRSLGGLLSAYELDGDKRFLAKAVDLGDRLIKAFDTKSGIPYQLLNLQTGVGTPGSVSIATAGTLQLEMQYLSDVSGDPKYAEKAIGAIDKIYNMKKEIPGLFPKGINPDNGVFYGNSYGVGGEADSFYEYLLKLWISTGDRIWRTRYDEAAGAILKHVLQISSTGRHYFFPDMYSLSNHANNFHHLSCFVGGMFGLGAMTQRTGDWTYQLDIGRRATDTCHEMYAQSKSGLGAESASVSGDAVNINSGDYVLRPEIIESIFYYHRFSHDPKYRKWGKDMINALEKHSRTKSAFQGIDSNLRGNDRMESFFLAETLKYLYLLFSDDDVISRRVI